MHFREEKRRNESAWLMRPVTPLSLSLSFSLLSACVFIPRYYNIDTISAAGWRASLIPPRAHPDAVLCVKRRPDYGRASFITLLHSTALPPERNRPRGFIPSTNIIRREKAPSWSVLSILMATYLAGCVCVQISCCFFLKKTTISINRKGVSIISRQKNIMEWPRGLRELLCH